MDSDSEPDREPDADPSGPSPENSLVPTRASPPAPPAPPTSPGKTILPDAVARAVSAATRSSSLAVRVGTLLTSYGFDAAKFTTLSSLELGRGILEGILHRAGQNALARSQSDLARADAESVMERSLESLHVAMTQVVFWTTAGFHAAETTLAAGSYVTQLLLSSLDQLLGSTDSSRAMASIVTLIRREFRDTATGHDGQKVGITDLVAGLCALAYLQRTCWRLPEEEGRRVPQEEIVWDVVVLSDGERVDVHEESLYGVHKGGYGNSNGGGGRVQQGRYDEDDDEDDDDDHDEDEDASPESRLRHQIMQSLPANTSVSITTSTRTQKTITVEFSGPGPGSGSWLGSPALSPPPGVELVEREMLSGVPSVGGAEGADGADGADGAEGAELRQRVVYRFDQTMLQRTGQGPDVGELVKHSSVEHPPVQYSPVKQSSVEQSSVKHPPVELLELPAPPLPTRRTLVGQTVDVPTRRSSVEPPSIVHPSPRETVSTKTTDGSKTDSTKTDSNKTTSSKADSTTTDNANQKRQRTPLTPRVHQQTVQPAVQQPSTRPRLIKAKTEPAKPKAESNDTKPPPKKTGVRQALKRAPASLWSRDASSSSTPTSTSTPTPASPDPKPKSTLKKLVNAQAARRATGPTLASNLRDKALHDPVDVHVPRSTSRAGFISVHEHRRESVVSQTDTYSVHSIDSLPDTPSRARRPPSALGRAYPPAYDAPGRAYPSAYDAPDAPPPRARPRPRTRAHTPSASLYSIATTGSQTSLVLSARHPKSAYTDSEAIDTLRCAGVVDGMFPPRHLLHNITRFMLYSSAAYGSGFLKFMRIARSLPVLKAVDDTHHEIRSFAHHTGSDPQDVLMASFVDAQGGSDTTGATGTGVPLVHYISLDHASKAVVLACRGTLGFEDVLADLACDYDDMVWRGKSYQVHKGVHASARRLLYGADGRVLYTLKEALDEFQDYGLVLCGHSLGGAVTALLGTMLAEPSPTGTGFVTSERPHHRLLPAPSTSTWTSTSTATSAGTSSSATTTTTHVCLPPGRPLHVYAYGPPATMSPALRRATRGLVTSIVQGNDLVPYLSLGVLHDFQAVALAFQGDHADFSRREARHRVWQALQRGLADKWYATDATTLPEDDRWALDALAALRAAMRSPKLVPPGEVFIVESSRVLRRDAFVLADDAGVGVGRPARRVVLKYVRDVDARFAEVRFGTSMLTDHSPAQYEDALRKLRLGVGGA
ncbi:hypothetical protein ACHAQA_007645 [Verticillium albo-atrum]